jgi:hypothetical protein
LKDTSQHEKKGSSCMLHFNRQRDGARKLG